MSLPIRSLLWVVVLATSAKAGDVSIRLDAGSGLSVRNNTGAIERLRVDEATGNIWRNGALFVHTTGSNLFVGPGAGNPSSVGGGNSAFGLGALNSNTGSTNSAVGYGVLRVNTAGVQNSGFGAYALYSNTTGWGNTAAGALALYSNSTGLNNTGTGVHALGHNATGSDNTALGSSSLFFNVGSGNSAVGMNALAGNTSGSRNVAVGRNAGVDQTTGNDNVYLANTGVAAESGQIKIGTVGTHTGTTIAGISGATSTGGIAVLVNASGTLGTSTSSARFKQDVRDMGDASDLLMRLRPVTFRYTEEAAGAEESKTPQYGLIAEEVAEVAPELVASDLDGRPWSVRYHELPALLLNEVQELERANTVQERTLVEQRALIAALAARMERLESR